ncbi:hypothetical protein B0H34DRAFT_705902 [Crassisporium funariophilum]|nr:hypothetical protein B0H34DRAFT_705902 [Crassisporium funariophilum]
MLFNNRVVFSGLFLSLAVAPALADIEYHCSDSTIKGDCTSHIQTFCAEIAKKPFEGFEDMHRCYLGEGYNCELTVYNSFNTTQNPSEANCTQVLNTVSKECPQGGEGRFAPKARFLFTIDPNNSTKEACAST